MRKFYCLLILLVTACDVFDKDEPIPAFVYIEAGDLVVASDGSEGPGTSAIRDAHIFANDIFVGTIELPGSVPILAEGNTKITVGAGIRNNGISSDRIIYPFYEFLDTNIDLNPGVVSPIRQDSIAQFEYFPTGDAGLVEILFEGFENIGNVWEPSTIDGAVIFNTSNEDEVLSGSSSGKIILDDDFPTFEVFSQEPEWDLSAIVPSSTVYLELDYKGNNPIEIGIRTRNPSVRKIFALGLIPTTEWTKVYVDLTNEIGQGQTNDFQIFLEAVKTTSDEQAIIYLDNMKVVYPVGL
ncbi:MAG TPA: hypothetical protein VJ894_00570 [Cryomorphaceae bacterium]|nr:hypothetical protein [Cryomorphaceae bacterium]